MYVLPDYLDHEKLLGAMVRALNAGRGATLDDPVSCRHAYCRHEVEGFSESDHEEAVHRARTHRHLFAPVERGGAAVLASLTTMLPANAATHAVAAGHAGDWAMVALFAIVVTLMTMSIFGRKS